MTESHSFNEDSEPPQRKRTNGCLIGFFVVIGLGALGLLAMVAGLVWLGTATPETSVYKGSQVPMKYIERMHELEALSEGETLEYFYTDGFTSIDEGFYFVSDRKVTLYQEEWEEPLYNVSFEYIDEAELERDESFFIDSQITLHLSSGESVWFPVSSEMDRDIVFHEAIVDRLSR